MQVVSNPVSSETEFIIEANSALVGETIDSVFPEDPPVRVAECTIECVDAIGTDQALLVLDELEDNGLNQTVVVERDQVV